MRVAMDRVAVRLALVWLSHVLGACEPLLGEQEEPSEARAKGCVEHSTPLVGDLPSPLGFSADEVARVLDGVHSAEVTWAGGALTRVLITVKVGSVHHVRSRYDAQQVGQPAAQCTDYGRVSARIELRTIDGALNEVIEAASLTTRGADEVHGQFELDANTLTGSHVTAWRGPHCPVALRVRVLFGRDGTHGSLTDVLRAGTCGADEGQTLLLAAGRWGARWLNY
jgi:hypothetical protein